jgi:hypothetical protein
MLLPYNNSKTGLQHHCKDSIFAVYAVDVRKMWKTMKESAKIDLTEISEKVIGHERD